MKQYRYKPSDIGRDRWPEGELRLQGIPETEDPNEADIFVCPGPLLLFQRPSDLDRFPYMRGREERHVFFDISDYETVYSKPCIFIRCNTRTWYFNTDPQTISWPWPAEDFAECVEVSRYGGFKYDISFQAWLSSEARKVSADSCAHQGMLTCDIRTYKDFTGYIFNEPEGLRRRAEFRRSMKESRIALCPESIPGVFPYRFFEAMSAGRVPLLVGTGYVLPFADEIPYSEFILECPTEKAHYAGAIARSFIEATPDAEIIKKGRMARRYFESHMNRDRWPEFMTRAVLKKLAEAGVAA